VRAPSVTIALLIMLVLGFGTAALADNGGSGRSLTTVVSGVTTIVNGGTTVIKPSVSGGPSKTTITGGGSSTAGDDPGSATTTGPASTTTSPASDAKNTKTKTTGTDTTATTGDATTSPTDLAPAAAPVLGKSAAVAPVSGDVNIKLPGRDDYMALGDAASVPVGATIDATNGTVRLTSAHNASGTPQSAEFHDGRFTLTGQTKGSSPVTNLVLKGGDFSACGTSALRHATAKHPPIRQLWGSGHGRFRTSGRYSAATVHGTIWLTRDTCDGTLTMVKRGVVTVYDKVRDKTVTVRAGHTYFAPAPLPIAAATKLIGF
jgi:hypothetical protein